MEKFLKKIVINAGIGRLREKSSFKEKILPEISKQMSILSGQKPVVRTAKKSISSFKIRKGDIIGLMVTLRGGRMEDFLKRLIYFSLPRKKDFKGLNLKSVDPAGCLTIGFKDQYAFPEIEMDKSEIDFGLEVTLVPKEKDRTKAVEMYKKIGIPFK